MAKKSASKPKTARTGGSTRSGTSKSAAARSTSAKKGATKGKSAQAAPSSKKKKKALPAAKSSAKSKTTRKAAPTKKTNVVAAAKKGAGKGAKGGSLGMSRNAMIATALGVAATAAAGFVAVRAASGRDRKVFHLMPHEKGWQVKKASADKAELTRETKKEALDAGRDVARKHEPSQLVVHRSDGTIQSAMTYGE